MDAPFRPCPSFRGGTPPNRPAQSAKDKGLSPEEKQKLKVLEHQRNLKRLRQYQSQRRWGR